MEKTAKPKLKAKWSDSPLFWQSNYEFVAPYDFEECIRRINGLGENYWDERSEISKFEMDSQQDNGGVFNFKMSGRASKVMLHGELRGQLIYENDNQTRVRAHVGFTLWSAVALFVLVPLICIPSFLQSRDTSSGLWVIGICVFGFIFVMQLWLGHSVKSQLYQDLRVAVMQRKSTTLKM